MELHVYLILFAAGLVAGVLNTVGGGGSVLTLPALIFAGVPGVPANGTNRIGILAQSLVALFRFRKAGVKESHLTPRVILIGLPGAVIGAYVATLLPNDQFEKVLGVLMLILLPLIIFKPKPHLVEEDEAPHDVWSPLSPKQRIVAIISFFALGLYAGFIQAGAGILILVTLGWIARLDLVRGNYIKLSFILLLNLLILGVFIFQSEIYWVAGLSVTAGQMLGAYVGTWVALKKGERWMIAILTIAILLSSAKLLGVFALLGL